MACGIRHHPLLLWNKGWRVVCIIFKALGFVFLTEPQVAWCLQRYRRWFVFDSAESNTPQAATVRVLSGGQVISEEAVNLSVGVNNFTVRVKAGEQEFSRFTVELAAANDTFTQTISLPPSPKS